MRIAEVQTPPIDSGKLAALAQFMLGRAQDTDAKKTISIQAGKTQTEAAQGVLTGQAPVVPGADAAAMPAGDVMPAADQSAEVDADLSLDANLPAEEPEAETPAASLGRERR